MKAASVYYIAAVVGLLSAPCAAFQPSSLGAAMKVRPVAGNGEQTVVPFKIGSPMSKLCAMQTEQTDDSPRGLSWEFNPFYASLAAIFLSWAFIFSPGSGDAATDPSAAMLEAFFANPLRPEGVNELFMVVFNLLGVMPMVLATLIFPQGSKKGLPAAPFTIASGLAGYIGIAPYLVFRDAPVDSKVQSEMGWISRNILENKLYSGALVLLLVTIPFSSGVIENLDTFTDLVAGYADLFQVSKFASVSTFDLVVLSIVAARLIPKDYELRAGKDDKMGIVYAVASLFLPVLGAALYTVARPPLPEE